MSFYMPTSKSNYRFRFNFVEDNAQQKQTIQMTSVSPTKFSLVKKKKNVKCNVINMSNLLATSPSKSHHEQLNKVLRRLYNKNK